MQLPDSTSIILSKIYGLLAVLQTCVLEWAARVGDLAILLFDRSRPLASPLYDGE